MKPIKTKAQIREELNAEIQSYLSGGGAVKNIPRGVSGNIHNKNLFIYVSDGPRSNPRTMLTHIVKRLEERKGKNTLQKPKAPERKKILIKDDFGEPLRWVWSDEQ